MKEKLAAYTAALNRYDFDAVEAMFAEDAVYISPGIGGEIKTRAAIMAAFRSYFRQHTDQVNIDEDIVLADAQTIRSRWRLKASTSNRSGSQRIYFNTERLIVRIEVEDEGSY
jgi:ketosteroid isomerase-like protein